jgi:hypothetical protein
MALRLHDASAALRADKDLVARSRSFARSAYLPPMKAMKKAMEAKKEDKKMKAMKKEKPMRAMKKTMKAKEKAKKNNHSGTRRSGTTRSGTTRLCEEVYRQLPRTTDTLVLDRITDNVGLEEVSSLKLLKEKNGCRVWVRIWNTV